MTPPALAPLAVAVAIATGHAAQPPGHSERPMVVPSTTRVVERAASATREHGAGAAGLAASSVAAPILGAGRTVRDPLPAAARPRAGSVRIRAPPG